ncbi:MAG: riboflavin biosynthesis protein RibF [Flavobacteriaceae bacterium]|nr:riboflavin biosynthesis protein RibF [Flavobacteriaceae bacterium]
MTSLNIKDYLNNLPSVITVGTFDGIHLGHQKLINTVLNISKTENLKSVVLTFNPHPKIVLNNNPQISLLTTQQEKIKILNSFNIDYLITQEFTKSFSRLSPLEFVRDILVNKLNAKHIVIGYDHHFGRNRDANSNQLLEFSKSFDFDVTEVEALNKNKISVSSTKIRNLIFEGNIMDANRYLGYDFILTGNVVKGLGRGKKLGFPTANINIDSKKIKPSDGVYFIYSVINKKTCYGMMNIGKNPTFIDKGYSMEVHLFDFNEDLYGKEFTIRMVKKIRDEMKFDSPNDLSFQLKIDKKKCFQIINSLKKTT